MINRLYVFVALICLSSGGTIYTIGIYFFVYIMWLAAIRVGVELETCTGY
jgi:hypothetical protein